MSYYNNDYDKARNRFYSPYKAFNYFKKINDEIIEKIDKLITEYRGSHKKSTSFFMSNYKTIEYMNVLNYLTFSKNMTYDEKILFLIRYFDPELKLLKLFFDSESIDEEEIEKENNDFIRDSLIDINLDFAAKCREEVGISDSYLVKYELLFFKYYKSRELKFNIKKDFVHKFYRTYPLNGLTLEISDEELDIIIKNALAYKKKYGIPNFNDLLFQLLEQRSLLSVSGKSVKELFIFMMFVLDEEFKALHIYDEYCNWNQIRLMCLKELGFFNQNFVASEIKFAKDNPNNKINLSLF